MIPTQRQIDLMDARDRAQFPRAIRLTTSERRAKNETEGEKALHNEFAKYLRLRKRIFGFVHADPTKRSTIEPGWPDFSVFCKAVLGPRPKVAVALIEFKAPGGVLSKVQVAKHAELAAAGIEVLVTSSVGDAISYLIEYFELPKEALI